MPYNWDKPIEIQDNRHPQWFWIEKKVWEDEGLTASDKVFYGTIAYFSHGRTQEAFPGLKRLSKESCLSKAQVALSIKKLESLKYISVIRRHGKNNIYKLLRIPLRGVQNLDTPDSGVSKIRTGGVQNKGMVGVQNTDTNNSYINNNIFNKNTNVATDVAGKEINNLLSAFKSLNPDYQRFFKNNTERKALTELVKQYGLIRMTNLLSMLPSLVEKPYAPRITSPVNLQRKMGELIIFLKQEKGKESKNGKYTGIDARGVK